MRKWENKAVHMYLTVKSKLKFVLLALAVLMMAYGILRGEAAVVLKKATAVCLECIGIG